MNKFGNALFAPVGGTAVTTPTFTRAGVAYDSAVTSYPANTPRFDGPDYEPTVNLALYSEQFDNAFWSKQNSTVTANQAIAPDGTLTADQLTDNGVSGTHFTQRLSLTTNSGPGCMSVYAKAGTLNWLVISHGQLVQMCYFNLANGTIGSKGGSVTSATIEDAGNGWYRCTVAIAADTTGHFQMLLSDSDRGLGAFPTYVGSGGYVYLWGAQAELKDHATPYVGATLGTPRARGILATEPTRNDVTFSQQFDNAAWTKTGSSIVPNAIVAPDGTLTAAKLVESAANQQHLVGQSSLGTGFTVPYTLSIYAKAGERTQLWVNPASSQAAYFNLDTGLVSGVSGTNAAYGMTPVGNGWYRCWVVVFAGPATNSASFWIGNSSANSYLGDGASGIYIWGAQYERIQGPSPYLVSGSTPANRAGADFKNGVVVEEGTTNLVQYSSALDNAWWAKVNATVTADAVVAPDGTLTADKLAEDTTTGTHYFGKSTLVAASTIYTLSFYIKAAERSWVWSSFNTAGTTVYFDLLNGKVGTKGANITSASITPVGGGWYRCTLTRDAADTGTTPCIGTATADSTNSYAGTAGSGIYVWGVQAEQKAYPTSLVPTSGANGVRVAETLTIPTAGIMKPDQGTIIVKFYADGPWMDTSSFPYLFNINGTAGSNVIDLRKAGSAIQVNVKNGAGTTVTAQQTVTLTRDWHTVGFNYGTSVKLFIDGTKRATGAANAPSSLTATASLGCRADGQFQANAAIAYIVIYDRELSEPELALATSGSLPGGYKALISGQGGVLKASGGVVNLAYDDQLFGSINRAPYTI